MPNKVSQLLTGGIRGFKQVKTNPNVTTIEPGLLVTLDSGGSTASLASPGNVSGWAWGSRYGEYRPTSRVYDGNEPFVIIHGDGEALLSADFFDGGVLPSAKDKLYASANGMWKTSGSSVDKVGDVIQIIPATTPTGGTGTSQNLAHIRFSIHP